jgi:site-specific recombinase XerD
VRERHPLGSLGALCLACEKSEAFAGKSKGYQTILLRQFKALVETYGNLSYRAIRDRHVQKDVPGASSPEARRKAWRFIYAFALEADLVKTDPTIGITVPDRPKSDGHPPWARDEFEAFRKRWKIGTTKRLAFELLFWTGARISDGVLIGPGMVDREGVLAFRQVKTGGMAYVPWTCALPAYSASIAEDREHLHRALSASAGGHMTFLATAQGRTRSEKALGTMIR